MKTLQLALIVAIVGVSAVFFFFNRTDAQLCNVIYDLVARSGATVGKPGTPGYAYYKQHPLELAKAKSQNQEFLNQLPCGG